MHIRSGRVVSELVVGGHARKKRAYQHPPHGVAQRESCLLRRACPASRAFYLPLLLGPPCAATQRARPGCVRACVNWELSSQQDRTTVTQSRYRNTHLRSAGHKHVLTHRAAAECCPTSLSCNERHVTSETTRENGAGRGHRVRRASPQWRGTARTAQSAEACAVYRPETPSCAIAACMASIAACSACRCASGILGGWGGLGGAGGAFGGEGGGGRGGLAGGWGGEGEDEGGGDEGGDDLTHRDHPAP